jgi:hypothetical protein
VQHRYDASCLIHLLPLRKQIPHPHPQRIRDLQQAPDRRIPQPTFNPGQVGPIQIRRFRQSFLGPSLRIPQIADAGTQRLDDRRL